MMEGLSKQGWRPPKVMSLARDLEAAKEEVEVALAKLKAIKEKIAPECSHAMQDLVCTEFGVTDTLGHVDYTKTYVTCKLCGKKLYDSND